MPLIPFPDVPQLPGVPAIPRSPNFPPSVRAGLGVLQGALWRAFQVDDRWGIYDKAGVSVFDPSKLSGVAGSLLSTIGVGRTLSTSTFDFQAESKVSDFPVEAGSFATYNKVELPYRANVTLCFSGSEAERTKFLTTLDAARTSTQQLDVVTPEMRFTDCAVERYSYRRSNASGVTMLRVEIALIKVRQITAQYGKSTQIKAPKDTGATPQADNGKVQAKTPQSSTLKSLSNKVPAFLGTVNDLIQGIIK